MLKRSIVSGSIPIALFIVVILVVTAATVWMFLRKDPATPYAEQDSRLPIATNRQTTARRLVRKRDGALTEADKPSPVTIASPGARHPEQRMRRRVETTPYSGHSELLAWIKATETIEDPRRKKVVLLELGRELCAENFENALLLAGGISDSVVRNCLYEGIFGLQSLSNPASALQAAGKLNPDGSEHPSSSRYREMKHDYHTALLAVVGGWATVDPVAALDFVETAPREIVGKATVSIYGIWAERNPADALERAGETTAGMRTSVFHAIFSGWARKAPAEAARYAMTLDDPALRTRVCDGIAEGFMAAWDPQNPRSTADWAIEVLPEEILNHLLPDMYQRWAESDPMAAASHALQLNRNYEIDIKNSLGIILAQWSQANVDDAVTWIDQTFSNDDDYIWAVSSLIGSMRHRAPGKVAELLERVPFTYADGTEGASEVARLMAFWCRKDPEAAIAWTQNLQNRDLKIVAIKTLAANWTSRDYSEALAWGQSLADPDMKAYALSNVALRQAMYGIQKSDDWIRELPRGFVKVRTAAGFVLGAMLRAKDNSSAEIVKQQLSIDVLDVSRLNQVVRDSSLDPETKDHLLSLLN